MHPSNPISDPCAQRRVAVARNPEVLVYPPLEAAPFHPSEAYPEYHGPRASSPNHAYALVRESLVELGLDRTRFGTPQWNPLGDLVRPGAKIVVKPNWVLHANEGTGGTDCLITHASILRAVLDYVFLAQPGSVIVGDAPVQVCDFAQVQALGFNRVADYFRAQGKPIAVKDFRRTVSVRKPGSLAVEAEQKPISDYVLVDLGKQSLLEPISSDYQKFRVTMYDPAALPENHRPGRHRYLVARDILEADLVVNVPKVKTHMKAGVTLALKNLVGINGSKEFLPHHRKGAANRGGDNYERSTLPKRLLEAILDHLNRHHLNHPRIYGLGNKLAYKLCWFDKKRGLPINVEGGWHGNDTVWRMCLDLNKILLYADANTHLHDTPQRAVLNIADALIAGEGEGPLRSDPHPLGAVLASQNAAALDWTATRLMGYDPARIPIAANAFAGGDLPLALFQPLDIESNSFSSRWKPFATPKGWTAHLE